MSNSFQLCSSHFFKGDEKFCREACSPPVPPLVTVLAHTVTLLLDAKSFLSERDRDKVKDKNLLFPTLHSIDNGRHYVCRCSTYETDEKSL